MTLRVLIADDHTLVREGLRALLEERLEVEVVAEATTGREAVDATVRLSPDVVLMDLVMPEVGGLEATRELLRARPATRVVMLSMHASAQHVREAFFAGAAGYLTKESAADEVAEAVATVAEGRRYVSRRIRALGTAAGRAAEVIDPLLGRLTGRELEVLTMVADGHTSADIAERLHLSPKTVETYRWRLMSKLGVNDTAHLVKLALRLGLTSLD